MSRKNQRKRRGHFFFSIENVKLVKQKTKKMIWLVKPKNNESETVNIKKQNTK